MTRARVLLLLCAACDRRDAPAPQRAVERGTAAMNRGGDGGVEEAAAAFREALARSPDDPTALFGLGWASERAGRTAEAERLYRRALAHRPPPDIAYFLHFNLGSLRLRAADFDEARLELRAAADLRPAEFSPWYNLGVCETRAARYADAIAPLQRAAAADPDHPGTRYNLGYALWQVGRRDEARSHWNVAVRMAPALKGSIDRITGGAAPPRPAPPR
jgi:Flp pilus assembly protein TadD